MSETKRTKEKKEKRIRARQFMYVQDLDHLKVKYEDLDKLLLQCDCSEYAWILHDKDVDKKGKKIRPHIHVDLKFSNPRDLSSISELFKDEKQYVQILKGTYSWSNGLAYLCHRTAKSSKKFQYEFSEVHSSFDYPARVQEIIEKAEQKKTKANAKHEIERFSAGEIDRNELERNLGVLESAKRVKLIDNIETMLLKKEHEKWVEERKKSGEKMFAFWFWGKAGVGKSQLARWLFDGQKYAVLGDSRDPFEQYHGEHYIILDDLRPNELAYSDLLRVLDPYNFDGKVGSARYHSKLLSVAGIIITCPYSPEKFWESTRIDDREVDTLEQLTRRVIEIEVTAKKKSSIVKKDQGEFFKKYKVKI